MMDFEEERLAYINHLIAEIEEHLIYYFIKLVSTFKDQLTYANKLVYNYFELEIN